MCTDTSKWQVNDYLTAAPLVGLSAARFVPASLRAQCQTVAQRNVPGSAPAGFVTVCTASLIARGIIYFKCNPGDCGSAVPVDLSTGQQVALGIGQMAASQLPFVGAFVSAIQGIFAEHAQAVANEQTTICKVAGVINQVFSYYDNLVITGQLSPSSAYTGMQSFLNQCTEQLGTIEKTCNAACVYIAILKAHADFVSSYYPAIAPVQASAHAPGAPPTALGTVPGGVVQVGGGSATGTVANSSAPVPGGDVWLALAFIVGLLVVVFFAAK